MSSATGGVNAGCVSSNNKVKYPVFVESEISVANIALASCFWLLSPDDTQEIDIIENYGGVAGYKKYTHISHHSFVRSPFTDYQPRDWNSWYPDARVNGNYGWGDWCWNNSDVSGNERRYMRMSVYWISPKHFEYYIDGELVRVMYYNAVATRMNGTWEYTYFKSKNWNVNGYMLPTNIVGGYQNGYTDVERYTTSSSYSLATLQAASNASNGFNVIDPAWFQGGDDQDIDGNGVTVEARGFTKELDIIINIESQSWLFNQGLTPNNDDLNAASKNQMKVNWVRVYKPTASTGNIAVTSVSVAQTASIAINGTITPSYSVLPSNATNKTVTWTSSNTSVATVNATTGLVTGKAVGTANITVKTADGNKTDVCVVTVSTAPVTTVASLTFDDNDKYLNGSFTVGSTMDVTVNYHAGTGNTVASGTYFNGVTVLLRQIYDDGNSWSVVKDYAITDATTLGKMSGSVIAKIDLTGAIPTANLPAGNFYYLYTLFTNSAGANITNSGLQPITIVAANSGNIAVASVSVVETASVAVNGTITPTYNVLPSNATNKAVTWTSSNTSVATVNATTGLVTGKAAGKANITVKTADGNKTDVCVVTVTATSTGLSSPFTLEAEKHDRTGGIAAGWNETVAGVKKEATFINYVNNGDYIEYDVVISEAGDYNVQFFICAPHASQSQNPKVQLFVDNSSKFEINVPNKGVDEWENFTSLTSTTKVYLSSGAHTIKVQANGSEWVWNLDKISFSKEVPTDLDNNTVQHVTLFPNPANEICYVRGAQNKVIHVYTITGLEVLQVVSNNNEAVINTNDLQAGIYIVFVDGVKTKLIVQ